MVGLKRRETLVREENDGYFYRIINSLDMRYEFSNMDGPAWLKVSSEKLDWKMWKDCSSESDSMSIINNQMVSNDVLSELAFLTLNGIKTGYGIDEIVIDYNKVWMSFNNRALNNIESNLRYLKLNFQYEAKTQLSLPTLFTTCFYTTDPDGEAVRFPSFTVMAPKPGKNGKIKWRKFLIHGDETITVEEYRKNHHREIRFLKPTEEQKAAYERTVEVLEHYL